MIPLLIFVIATVALLLYEGWALWTRRVPTITELVRKVFTSHPWIAAGTTLGLAAIWLHFLVDWP